MQERSALSVRSASTSPRMSSRRRAGCWSRADADAAARIRRLALHGLSADAWKRFSDEGFKHYEVEEPGFKYNMTDSAGRTRVAATRSRRDGTSNDETRSGHATTRPSSICRHRSPHRPSRGHAMRGTSIRSCSISTDSKSSRDQVQRELHDLEIGTGIHYRAVHLHPYYNASLSDGGASLDNASWVSERTISLPLGPAMIDQDVDDVIEAVNWVLSAHERGRTSHHGPGRRASVSGRRSIAQRAQGRMRRTLRRLWDCRSRERGSGRHPDTRAAPHAQP